MATIFTVSEDMPSMGLVLGTKYYKLPNAPKSGRVLLVSLGERTYGLRRLPVARGKTANAKTRQGSKIRFAKVVILPRTTFESLLDLEAPVDARRAHVTTSTDSLPPWLERYHGTDFDNDTRFHVVRNGRKQSSREYVEHRLVKLQPLLETEVLQEILNAPDPDRALNATAKALGINVNETRLRLWFYSYLVFDRNKWVLCPPWNDGEWNRGDEKYAASAPGRPAKKPWLPRATRMTEQMITAMGDGFIEYAGTLNCNTWAEIWAMVARNKFGATFVKCDKTGEYKVVQNRGPVPTPSQFRRYVRRILGADRVRAHMIGAHRFRVEEQPFLGSQADDLVNVGERAHYDSSVTSERPKAFLGSDHLEPAHFVHLVDGKSGQISGIGQSLGAEKGKAYLAALFCAAIPKSEFGRIIGYPISDDDWPGHGLPAHVICDGGPAFSEAVKNAVRPWSIKVERTPAYQPMSNATAESKHGRETRQEGPPKVRLSNLNAIDMLKREAAEAIRKNRSGDVSGRASDRAVVEAGVRSPNGLYRFLDERKRSSLIQIPFDTAVRTFLDVVTFRVKKGRLYLFKREYRPEAPSTSPLSRHIAHWNGLELRGYALQFAPRFAWVELQGRLYEVKAVTDAGDPDRFATLPELEITAAARSRIGGDQQAVHYCETLVKQERVLQETGKEINAGHTVKGRKKRLTKEAADEMRRLKQRESSR